MRCQSKWRFATLVVLLGLAAPVTGQEPGSAAPAAQCAGQQVKGDLGYDALSCTNCTHFVDRKDPTRDRWEFRSEPIIEGIRPGGPADGVLRSGDAVVAIDGYLITTREGGRRFAQVEPDRVVEMTVRRGTRDLVLSLVPETECQPPVPPSPGVAPGPPPPAEPVGIAVVPRVTELPVPPVPTARDVMPSGWVGFSITCSDCGIHVGEDAKKVWWFAEPPVVESVERRSPADAAGIRGGDRLTRIDGLAITSEEAGRRFGSIRPGDRVRFQIDREGREVEAELVAGERESRAPRPDRPEQPPPMRPPPAPSGIARAPRLDVVRFTGLVGTALVEVTGGPITVTETEDEVIIQSSDITVRIRKAAESEMPRR